MSTILNYEIFQQRCAAWRKRRFPEDHENIAWVALKGVEEYGEVARAIIGEHEGRPDRGDPVKEAAQVILVICSLVGQFYPDRNVIAEAFDELIRQEGILES